MTNFLRVSVSAATLPPPRLPPRQAADHHRIFQDRHEGGLLGNVIALAPLKTRPASRASFAVGRHASVREGSACSGQIDIYPEYTRQRGVLFLQDEGRKVATFERRQSRPAAPAELDADQNDREHG